MSPATWTRRPGPAGTALRRRCSACSGRSPRGRKDAGTARDLAARFRRSCENGRNAAQRDSILGRLRLIASVLAEKDTSRGAAQWVGSIEDELAATTEPPPSARPPATARRETKAKQAGAGANEPGISLKD